MKSTEPKQQSPAKSTEGAKRMRKVLAERAAAEQAAMAAIAMQHAAANTIQEYVRSFLSSKGSDATSRAKWPKLWELRQLFMDDNAVEAGAEENKWYTDEMLLQRELLREHSLVTTALKDAWESLLPPGCRTMTKQAYWEVGRRLYLALAVQTKSIDVDPYDCIERIGGDWMDDSDDHGVIDYDGFRRAWFQLADLNTDGVGAARYAKWVRNCTNQITLPNENNSGWQRRQLRKSRDLLETCFDLLSEDVKAERIERWEAVMHPERELGAACEHPLAKYAKTGKNKPPPSL